MMIKDSFWNVLQLHTCCRDIALNQVFTCQDSNLY